MDASREAQFDALTVAMSRVVTPVVICMAFSVWLVNSLGDPKDCAPIQRLTVEPLEPFLEPFPSQSAPRSPGGVSLFTSSQALIFVGIFCGLIVIFTFVLVWLFKAGLSRYIARWVFMAVAITFAYVGGIYLFEFCRSRCINLDWISLVFGVWNFTIVGLVSVFGTVPRVLNQAYLIVMSALMAYIFRTLPGWATWTILAVLVVWDLFAVLTPCGPLRMLVETAKERNEPLPALVYDTNPNDIGRDPEARPAMLFKRSKKNKDDDAPTEPAAVARASENGNGNANGDAAAARAAAAEKEERRLRRRARKEAKERDGAAEADADGAPRQQEEIRVGTLGAHLKLGLGDFVFYSVLVAQASHEGAMTTIISFVAILAGLCATLFLVIVYKKALPALPISIVSGMIFYVLTRWTVRPFVLNLFPELLFH